MRIPKLLGLIASLAMLQACDDSKAAPTAGASSNVDPALIGRWISATPSNPLTNRDTANIAVDRIQTPYFSAKGSGFTARDGRIGFQGNYSEDYEVSGDTLWLEFVLSSESDGKVNRARAQLYLRRTTDTVAPAVVAVSEADDVRLGKQFDADLRANSAEYPLYSGAELTSYVQGVMDMVAAAIPASEKPGYPLQKVQLIDKPGVINAFAVPGGYIYVYTGLLKALDNESELAALLGHEITHVTHHHYRNQLAKLYGIETLVGLLRGDATAVSLVAANLVALKFSRDNEFDADKTATLMAGSAGWNPLGVATFFARLDGSGFDWIFTHPASSDRVAAVNAQVNSNAALKALAARTDNLELVGDFAAIKAMVK
jgi:beta-barrel assembly-enhancing protease